MSGASLSMGGSGGAAVSIGGEMNIPLDGNANGISYSGAFGAGVGAEGHVTISYTTIQKLW